MCEEYVEDQVKELITKLSRMIEELKLSKRLSDKIFQGPYRIMVRRTYDSNVVTYILFIVPETQTKLCAHAWEIIGSFVGLREDLYQFIKSKMFENAKTDWFPMVFYLGPQIICYYDPSEIKKLSFINNELTSSV